MLPINHSKSYKEVCEFYDILTVSKCGPYFDAPQTLSLETREDKTLHCRYAESYYPSKGSRLNTMAATGITFFDFDEYELEHQRILKLALLKLNSALSSFGVEVFYKSKLMSYNSPIFKSSTSNKKYFLQQCLLDLYREATGSLLGLDFTKSYFFEMDVHLKEPEFKQYGRILFDVQDQFSDSLKEKEIKRRIQAMEKTAIKHNFSEERVQRLRESILNPANYQERRSLYITFLQEFHLGEEEFQKLKKIINDYGFGISAFDTRKEYQHSNISELSLGELEELLVIK